MKSQFRHGWKLWLRDTREDPQVFYSGLIVAVALVFVFTVVAGVHP